MAQPFVKWAGGKRKLISELLKRLPNEFDHYHEPFVGGGALFFALKLGGMLPTPHHRGSLNDANEELINAYWAVRDHVEDLIELLRDHAELHRRDPSEHYYLARARAPEVMDPTQRAARFIYLNKTCFNGLYRVNKSGQFNVPLGRYKDPLICDPEGLQAASEALHGVILTDDSYDVALSRRTPREGDLVYFDPPYIPLSETSNFTAYTERGFGPADQIVLRNWAWTLKRNGVHVILSQADTPVARDLYKNFQVETVQCGRSINSKAKGRGKINELIIS